MVWTSERRWDNGYHTFLLRPVIETCCLCGIEVSSAVSFYRDDFDRLMGKIDCIIGESEGN